MIYKKIKLLLISFVFSAFSYAQAETELALLIKKNDSTSVAYCLKKFPVISFHDECLEISYSGLLQSYDWKELSSFSYIKESDIPNSVNNIDKDNNFSVVFYDRRISVISKSEKTIQIFDISGKQVLSVKVNKDSRNLIDLSHLPSGCYVFNCSNSIFKFFVR